MSPFDKTPTNPAGRQDKHQTRRVRDDTARSQEFSSRVKRGQHEDRSNKDAETRGSHHGPHSAGGFEGARPHFAKFDLASRGESRTLEVEMGRVDSSNIPLHVALIMDGNRRWARKRGFFPLKGHLAGEERIEPIVDRAIELGIGYLTFWAFSTENWKRSKREVGFLMNIFRENLSKKVESFQRKNVKINVIGNVSMFPNDIQEKTKAWIEKTKHNSAITVNIALSYGGRDEIVRGIGRLIDGRVKGALRLSGLSHKTRSAQDDKLALKSLASLSSNVTAEEFKRYLDTGGQPDPDLLIRTGGEFRLSGFMLWQIAYTELYFTDTYWPDFTVKEFDKAIAEYQSRQRRFGR